MTSSQHEHAAAQYAPRAQDYVTSVNHSTGEDLAQIEATLRGAGIGRVLDLGCGGGHVSYRAAPHVAQVVAYDLTATMLDAVAATAAERGLPNITTAQGPAEQIPFETASFDAVLCRFTAHHWQNFEAGLREARRVLKPGGLAIFIDTICPADKTLDSYLQAIEVLRDASHVRNYNLAEWTAALARANFTIASVTPRTLRLEFPVWTARTRTPALHADAIRALQTTGPASVRDHYAIGDDGSFTIDSVTFTATAGG
jgi:ubiquinone/menaquinone biosynthesis C-methylase UbiE